MITKMKGFALGVVTADCVPIILYDIKNEILDVFMLDGKVLFLE
jgi:copper oxidase (laccase) domain-containing protein